MTTLVQRDVDLGRRRELPRESKMYPGDLVVYVICGDLWMTRGTLGCGVGKACAAL